MLALLCPLILIQIFRFLIDTEKEVEQFLENYKTSNKRNSVPKKPADTPVVTYVTNKAAPKAKRLQQEKAAANSKRVKHFLNFFHKLYL